MDRKKDRNKPEGSRKHKKPYQHHGGGSGGSGSHHKKRKGEGSEKREIAADEQPINSKYRDRAKERREGINKDFDLDPDDLIFSNPTVPGTDIEEHKQKIEESKYLGGDVEHTHLVKGLDFALLEKIKSQSEQQQQQHSTTKTSSSHGGRRGLGFGDSGGGGGPMFDASDSDEEEFTKEAIQAANATATSKRGQINIETLRSSDIISCRTALARRILKTLDEKLPDRSELFLPGRMSYVVPVDEEADSTVTTILRSKAEQESETLNEKDLAFDQLINIFGKIRKKK